MIGVINYDAGNIKSITNALHRLKIPFIVSGNVEDLQKTDQILFPGVGHAKSAMQLLQEKKIDVFLRNYKKPILGICLGMQLLFDFSEEGNTPCLGLIPGKVKKFNLQEVGIVPHTGWNTVSFQREPEKTNFPLQDFYFVHSYYCIPDDTQYILGETEYDKKIFCSAVQKQNITGIQFHPEKSGIEGEKLLSYFLGYEIKKNIS